MVNLVYADIGYDNPNLPKLKTPIPSVTQFNNNTGSVNNTNCWTTQQGVKCNVPDIKYSNFGGSGFWDTNVDLNGNDLTTLGTGTFGDLESTGGISSSGNIVASGLGVYIEADGLKIATGSITDPTGSISFENENLITAGKLAVGKSTAPSYPIDVNLSPTDTRGLYIDGSTNDFTTSDTSTYGLYVTREADFKNNNYGQLSSTLSTCTLQSTGNNWTILNENGEALSSAWFSTYNNGQLRNNESAFKYFYPRAFDGLLDDNAKYDTNGTGRVYLVSSVFRAYLDNDQIFTDSGGVAGGSAYSDAIGFDSQVFNNPTLTSGTLTVRNYGLKVSLTGTTVGSSSNYGIFLGTITGADTNFAVYDDTGADWILDADNQIFRLGEGIGDFEMSFDGVQPKFEWADITKPAWFEGNVSSTGFMTRTSVYDKTRGNALNYIRDADDYTDIGNRINHSRFYGYTTYQIRDSENCWNVPDKYCFNETFEVVVDDNGTPNMTDDDIIEEFVYSQCDSDFSAIPNGMKYWIIYREECGTKTEEGILIDDEVNVLRQAVYELNVKIQELEDRIMVLERGGAV